MVTHTVDDLTKKLQALKTSPGLTLVDLPIELIDKIFSLLDWRVVLRCKTVCKAFQMLIDSAPLFNYPIELKADGLVDSPLSDLRVPERLKILLQRREAWRELNWTKRVPLPSSDTIVTYELVGGVFGTLLPSKEATTQQGATTASRRISYWQSGQKASKITLTYLPSSTRKEDVRVVTHEDVGVDCRDFSIDPAQDLLTLIQSPRTAYDEETKKCKLIIHLRTMSTNEKHPKALNPFLSVQLSCAFDAVTLQICDDIIAVFVNVQTIPRVFIWQWTSGTLLVGEKDTLTFRYTDSFSLISSRALMSVTHHPIGTIRVYPFEAPDDTQWTPDRASLPLPPPVRAFAPPDAPVESVVYMHPRRHVNVYLPTLLPGIGYSEISSYTAPFTSTQSADKPFHTSEDVRVHIMSLVAGPQRDSLGYGHSYGSRMPRYGYGGMNAGKAGSYTAVVANRTLVEQAERARRDFKGEEFHVQWTDWGPQNTRWFTERLSREWLSALISLPTGARRSVHGSRLVHAKLAPDLQSQMQVLDFNVDPKRSKVAFDDVFRGPEVTVGKRFERRIVGEETQIYEPTIFYTAVLSSLPYTEVTSDKALPYAGFMIDDERIVGHSDDMKRMEVFTF